MRGCGCGQGLLTLFFAFCLFVSGRPQVSILLLALFGMGSSLYFGNGFVASRICKWGGCIGDHDLAVRSSPFVASMDFVVFFCRVCQLCCVCYFAVQFESFWGIAQHLPGRSMIKVVCEATSLYVVIGECLSGSAGVQKWRFRSKSLLSHLFNGVCSTQEAVATWILGQRFRQCWVFCCGGCDLVSRSAICQPTLSDKSVYRMHSFETTPKANRKFCLRMLLVFALSCRLGEAAVPGPSSFTIGVCNPSGITAKAHLLDAQDADVWLVSETHLTVEGLRAFKQQLKSIQSSLKWIAHGSPVLPRQIGSEVGQWSGVASISRFPTRLLTPTWDESLHQTARIVCSTSFCCKVWVTGVVVYGTPVGPTHPNARKTTGVLLEAAIERVLQSSGCRYVAGDWNGDAGCLPAIAKLQRLGFREVQDIEFSRTGRLPSATCRGRTRRDFMFLSPELARRFLKCEVDELAWTDHASIKTWFQGNDGNDVRSVWPVPGQLEWNLACVDRPDVEHDFVHTTCLDDTFREFWKRKEQQVCNGAKTKGVVVPPQLLGRASRVAPKLTNAPTPSVKQGRAGDLRPSFHGFSMLHLQWFRQLRRLQHFSRLAKAQHSKSSQAKHLESLWKAIRQASGFKPSFAEWWSQQSHPEGCPCSIPVVPPSGQVSLQLFEAFDAAVRSLEKNLNKHRAYSAKLLRASDINMLYRAVRRDSPEQVDVLINECKGTVEAVDSDSCAVEFRTPVSWNPEQPFFHNGRELQVNYCEADKLWLGQEHDIQAGDVVVQPNQVGATDVLFEAFREQWNRRWNRHEEVPPDRWRVIQTFAESVLPKNSIPHLQCDASLMLSILRSKKRSAATGMDGISRQDLLQCSLPELQSLAGIFVRAEQSGEWPAPVLKGAVRSLAKIQSPSQVNHFRPITVFGMLYRCWSSVQSKYLLNALEDRLCPLLFGNRSNRRASDLWRTILDAVEAGHIQNEATTGLVFDLEKAYNTLPRMPTLHALAILGVPQQVLQAWASALANIERFFVVHGQYSAGLFSNCGFAEGCGLSCLAMVAIDELYHQWLLRANIGATPLSFVDNWEVLLQNPARASDAFNQALSFAQALDLSIDVDKTYAWSTCSDARCLLRSGGFRVLSDDRDLGAHVVYTKQIRNLTIKKRISGLADFWSKLKIAKGSHLQRVRVVKTAAWPRALHGISGSFLGKKHWESLRSEYLKSMNLAKPGVSPVLQFVIDGWTLDPQACALIDTLRDFRDFGCNAVSLHRLWQAVQGQIDLPVGSVTSILLSRVAMLGWTWIGEGVVRDNLGYSTWAHVEWLN